MKNQIFTSILLLCAAVCFAQNDEQGANRSATDNIELNHGILLPEITVSDEVQVRTVADDDNTDRADEFKSLDFRLYALKAERIIAQNESDIALIKEKLKTEKGKAAIKHWH